ncbi:hypothetical protein BU23DRAFT_165911 [Bimuria novae-zelandiae CBS 107.79]|uniref:Uncharacterized protein n=1 Tax=Bimuria novae-zelandiae CBS 107.79 TaxID=1447943 RepID=A0A6A5VAP6_9PLEO|nr:hypothetical protein BU23DRAFT_165911 [Bimuria novae-zelandiae CBS 107.79]
MVLGSSTLFVVYACTFPPLRKPGPNIDLPVIPSTKYSLRELDQAIALATGIITLIYSAYDAYKSWILSDWDRYLYWRRLCNSHIESGFLGASEASLWKEQLSEFDSHVKEVLQAPETMPFVRAIEEVDQRQDQEFTQMFCGDYSL